MVRGGGCGGKGKANAVECGRGGDVCRMCCWRQFWGVAVWCVVEESASASAT